MDEKQRKLRAGHLTASRFADLLTEPRSKEARIAGLLSQTSERYCRDILAELLTDAPLPEIYAAPMAWGNEQEPQARIEYQRVTENMVVMPDPLFIQHPGFTFVGCSPDGLVGSDGLIEIKCPYTTATHVSTLIEPEVPVEYAPQVQGQLWVTGRQWCDFVSYDPRIVYDGLQICIVRVVRDEDMIQRIEEACLRSWKWIIRAREAIVNGR